MGARVATLVTRRLGSLLILLATVAISGLVFATSPEQPAAEPTDGLPSGKQSTQVVDLEQRFASGQQQSVVVVVESTDGPLTDEDQAALRAVSSAVENVEGVASVVPPVVSEDGEAALIVAPLTVPATNREATTTTVDALREALRDPSLDLPAGLTVQVTGGAAFARDIAGAFEGADVTLLIATATVVALLLLVTYRSPFLWIVPLLVIGLADQLVAKLMPWIAQLVGERTDASVAGIVSVLVFGAGTDYALLLIARYRESLRRIEARRDAMADALRHAGPAILASAGTVILAVLTLLAAVLTSNRTLGIAAAVGVSVALVFGLLVLPAALVCLPRGVFWPFVPRVGSDDPSEKGLWAKVATAVSARPRTVLAGAGVVLALFSAGLIGTEVGLAQTDVFRTEVESVQAQETLAEHFPAGSSQPAVVIADADAAEEVTQAVQGVEGVASVSRPETSTDGELVSIRVGLDAQPGTPEADQAVRDLRDAVATVEGADALVGGAPAESLDKRAASLRDTLVIAPLVLVVVLFVLLALLRAVVAPLLLVATVVLSYVAALGGASVLLRTVFDIPALDDGVILLSFLFLVALGVDYNIFLVTRAREETVARGGTAPGMTRALAATGGVITSAGILLAAVFTVLGVLPVIVLTQLGVIVGIGVLLDTLLVRTVVVPALALLTGERFWWPAHPGSPAPAAGLGSREGAGSGRQVP